MLIVWLTRRHGYRISTNLNDGKEVVFSRRQSVFFRKNAVSTNVPEPTSTPQTSPLLTPETVLSQPTPAPMLSPTANPAPFPNSEFRIVSRLLDNNANVNQSVSFQLSHGHVVADRQSQHLLASQKGRFPNG
jgi:hypothetical protein